VLIPGKEDPARIIRAVSYPNGPTPYPPPDPRGNGPSGRLAGGRRALSLVWALSPVFTCGVATFAAIGFAAIRLRSTFHALAAVGYFAALLGMVALADSEDTLTGLVLLALWGLLLVGGVVHALLIREAVFAPSGASPPPSAPPGVSAPPAPAGHATPYPPGVVTPPGYGPAPGSWPPVPPGPGARGWATVPGQGGPAATPPGPAWGPAGGTGPGRQRWFGPYLLLDRLGEGGQGAVFLARHPDGSPVALKLLHHRLSDTERESFMRELTAARRVPSFSTARILDAGVLDGIAYIVSEYVDGPSLQRKVEESGPLGGDSLIRLAIATSGALAAIHKAGIVHRDFKPANVLLASDGPRVIDFGVAKALDQTTTTAGVKGTPLYMSPEQINGEPVTPASDMFSWASTMIYGGTGRVPFAGTNPYQVLHQIVSKEPDLSGLPEPLVRPIAACLDKNPRNRPKAAELIAAITG
jgi:predicted Ser/Thr protein kinase